MADRCTLHRSKVEAFVAWAQALGWRREQPRGVYEVLRLRHEGWKHPFIAYDRGSPEHVSVPRTPDGKESNIQLVRAFIRSGR